MKMWKKINGNIIHSTAIIEDNVKIGTNNIIYPYAVIGLQGFNRGDNPSDGIIEIGNNNQIGAHTSIMAGISGKTIIGDSNMIMNYVNIGHNCMIGNNNEIGAGSLLCGWVTIGHDNKLKVSVSVRNRKTINNECIIGMKSNVTSNLTKKGLYYGNPCKFIKNI